MLVTRNNVVWQQRCARDRVPLVNAAGHTFPFHELPIA